MTLEEFYKIFSDYKMKIEGKSKNTTNQYIYRIKDFVDFNNIETLQDFIDIKSENVKKWLSHLADEGNSERTRNLKLTAIKEIYKYAYEECKFKTDKDILRIPFAKVPKRDVKFLDGYTSEDLIAFISDTCIKMGLRIIFETGVRYCELIQITCEDIKRGYANIIGKGNKERRIDFNDKVIDISMRYINGERKKIVQKYGKQNCDILFIGKKGTVINRFSFERSMKYWAKKFNEDPKTKGRLDWWEHFSPHKMRHAFATNKLNNGVAINDVRDMMGHETLATTNNYAHSLEKNRRNAFLNIGISEDSKIVENLLEKAKNDKMVMEKLKQFLQNI